MQEQLFAYSLSQVEQGWTWSLWDEDGCVVAAGDAPDQVSAERRLSEAIQHKTCAAGATDRPPAEPLAGAAGGRRRRKGSGFADRRLDSSGLFASP